MSGVLKGFYRFGGFDKAAKRLAPPKSWSTEVNGTTVILLILAPIALLAVYLAALASWAALHDHAPWGRNDD